MLDQINVGSEVSIGELTLPANGDSGEHEHAAIEVFYVLSGEYEHVVNGKSQIYLLEGNLVLRAAHGRRRLRLTDD